MSIDPWRTPVVVGVGQHMDRTGTSDPVTLAARAAEVALEEAPGISTTIDRLHVVNILVGGGPAPATALARQLGIETTCATTTIGGNTPQWLVGRAADAIAVGAAGTVLIAGAEALHSFRRAGAVPSPYDTSAPDPVEGDPRAGLSAVEMTAGLAVPAQVYPMFEMVLAARSGHSLEEHRRILGALLAPFTEVAAAHRCAWFPQVLAASDIATVTEGPENRLVSEPYTKRMHAFLNVDQAAAIVVSSLGRARELGLEDQVVFVCGQGDATDVWFPSTRPDLGRSPGIAAATTGALEASGIVVDEVTWFDLYSCFPSALQMAMEPLGLTADDARGLTVTGGLPYFGGPGNNYTTHAIATMVQRLRDADGPASGLVTGLGWYVTKHSAGLYANRPPEHGYRRGDTTSAQRAIDASAVEVAEQVDAQSATVEAATVLYGRDGSVTGAPAFVRLADGRRAVASAAPSDLPGLAGTNLVGATVHVEGSPVAYQVVEMAVS